MSINSEQDLQGMQLAAEVVKESLKALERAAEPGVTTEELDAVCAGVFRRYGAISAPKAFYDAPVHAFISVNEDVVHGMPTARKLEAGDVVKLDVTPFVGGYVADAAKTLLIGGGTKKARRLVECAEAAFWAAMDVLRAGRPLNAVGRAIEREVKRRGFRVIRELAGHGVGRAIHEEPEVFNFYHPHFRQALTPNLVLAVEPMVAAGNPTVTTRADGWTVGTQDGSLTAHFEHTVVVTQGQPLVLTA